VVVCLFCSSWNRDWFLRGLEEHHEPFPERTEAQRAGSAATAARTGAWPAYSGTAAQRRTSGQARSTEDAPRAEAHIKTNRAERANDEASGVTPNR